MRGGRKGVENERAGAGRGLIWKWASDFALDRSVGLLLRKKEKKSGAGFPHPPPGGRKQGKKKANTGSTRVLLQGFVRKVWVLAQGRNSGCVISSHIPSLPGRPAIFFLISH